MANDTAKPRQHRQRVLKRATIILGMNDSEIGCTIRNQHSSGAELTVPPDAMVPGAFLLYVPVDGIAYRAVVRWQKKDRVGVQFTATEPKPRFHYG